ncbi:hypothetical protein [Brevibacillus thermoruber]|uniref:Uncharacterized protein n=1 Tax=Brevibacillus thermoruber TaxID=33942 RepID=A0A9X3TV41_9BACL|nr:hypothetical protein [Brevibacillus thermoruber]MDA5111105.1 hypothetical protein [Brevibacillus thermoruber]
MKSSLVNRVLCLFFAVALLFTSINIPVNAATSQSYQKNIDRIAELTIESENGKETTITIFLTKGTKLDETTFQGIKDGIKVTNITIKPFNDKDQRNLQALSSDGEIRPLYVETIFDVGNFTMSLAEFIAEPSFWTGFWVVMDGASVVFPGIPSISGVKRMIKNSDTLRQSLEIGINTYNNIDKIPSGWHRHHIFEKRFASRLGTHKDDMLCIAIPKEYHDPITSAMRKEIPYGSNYNNYTRDEILETHIDVYRQLWEDTDDEVYEFLYKFAREKQHSVRR